MRRVRKHANSQGIGVAGGNRLAEDVESKQIPNLCMTRYGRSWVYSANE